MAGKTMLDLGVLEKETSIENSGEETNPFKVVSQSSQTEENITSTSTQTNAVPDEWKLMNEKDRLMETVRKLEYDMMRMEAEYKKEVNHLKKRNRELETQLVNKTNQLERTEGELEETYLEFGSVRVELTRMKNEKKREAEFGKIFKPKSANVTPPNSQPSSLMTSDAQLQAFSGDIETNSQNLLAVVSEQVSSKKSIGSVPTTAEKSVHNNYKLLLCTISDQLLPDEAAKLRVWASRMFATNVSSDIREVFRDLERKKVISTSDLNKLKEFLWTIQRIDMVHIIDCFLLGDFSPLYHINSSINLRGGIPRTDGSSTVHSRTISTTNGSISGSTTVGSRINSTTTVSTCSPSTDGSRTDSSTTTRGILRNTSSSQLSSGPIQRTNSSTRVHSRTDFNTESSTSSSTIAGSATGSSTTTQGMLRNSNSPTPSRISSHDPLPQFSPSPHHRYDENEEFQSVNRSLDESEEFSHLQHWTRRINQGVFPAVQLNESNRCRVTSAHEQCCICLEDAFTGCQILPCSHKVHKDCATQMIQRRRPHCPVCKKCFAREFRGRSSPPPNS